MYRPDFARIAALGIGRRMGQIGLDLVLGLTPHVLDQPFYLVSSQIVDRLQADRFRVGTQILPARAAIARYWPVTQLSTQSSTQPIPYMPRQFWVWIAIERLPVGHFVIPRRCLWLCHAGELVFEHVAPFVRAIGRGPVPAIEIDDGHRASRAAQAQFVLRRLFRISAGDPVVPLPSRHHAGGTHIQGDVLRVVKGHHPTAAVIADILVEDVVVLVPSLAVAAGGIEVAVAVRVHQIARAQNTGQGTVHSRVCKNLGDGGDARRDIVAGVAFGFQHRVDLAAYFGVKIARKIRLHLNIALGDELLHLGVGERVLFDFHNLFS